MHILCDTNVLSELARSQPDEKVMAWSKTVDRVTLSVITLEEISFGLAWKPNTRISQWFNKFIKDFCEVLPITPEIATQAGNFRGMFRQKGQSHTQADMLIAATASIHGLILVTRNTRDFTGCNIRLHNPIS
jgi:predicted nucleic acid-binding protein